MATLHVGDQVLAEDPATGKVKPEAVIDGGVKPLMAIVAVSALWTGMMRWNDRRLRLGSQEVAQLEAYRRCMVP